MAMEEEVQVEVRDFKGMVSNRNPHTLEPGQAVLQVNCLSRRPGELTVRGGLRLQTWDTEA